MRPARRACGVVRSGGGRALVARYSRRPPFFGAARAACRWRRRVPFFCRLVAAAAADRPLAHSQLAHAKLVNAHWRLRSGRRRRRRRGRRSHVNARVRTAER